jgi:hypothetical protein
MRAAFGNPEVTASEIGGQYRPGRDSIVPPTKFTAVCRVLWPVKTAANIAAIAGKDERTGKRWLAGEFEAPACVYAAIFAEMLKRD